MINRLKNLFFKNRLTVDDLDEMWIPKKSNTDTAILHVKAENIKKVKESK